MPVTIGDFSVIAKAKINEKGTILITFNDTFAAKIIVDMFKESWLMGLTFDFLAVNKSENEFKKVNLTISEEKVKNE